METNNNHNSKTIDGRVEIVNEIIKEISSRGRKFFSYENKVAYVFIKKNNLYFKDPYSGCDILLNKKHNRKPYNFTSVGTLWGLINDLKDYVFTGVYSNGNSGYNGLFSTYWGYPEEDMEAIRNLAKTLGYLKKNINMNKLQTVQASWIDLGFEPSQPDENGWIDYDFLPDGFDIGNLDAENRRSSVTGKMETFVRPKLLRGIENNNGYTKIKDKGYPTKEIDCFFIKGKLRYNGLWDNKLKRFYCGTEWIKDVSHYHEIILPEKLPLY